MGAARIRGISGLMAAVVAASLALTSAGCSLGSSGTPKVPVEVAASDRSLVGKRVRVEGVVVPSSWDGRMSPMKFVLIGSEVKGQGKPDLTVLYDARPPASQPPADFGGGTSLVAVGTIARGGVLRAESIADKVPVTYESPPMSVAYLDLRSQQISGGPAELVGFVVPGSIETSVGGVGSFVLQDSPSSGYTLPIRHDLTAPGVSAALRSGGRIRVSGAAGQDGSFWATRIVSAP
jgi:cytochrome c-type biogenesis protein CcmE